MSEQVKLAVQRSIRKALAQRDKEWREALLGDEAVEAVAQHLYFEDGGTVHVDHLPKEVRDSWLGDARAILAVVLDKAAPNGGGE